jgi:hypothetical protein
MSGEKVHILQSTHGVVQSPDGEIQYFTNSINNKHNPYLSKSIVDEENGIEYSEIECNGDRILISTANLNRALHLECKATIVRFLCLVDFFMNLFVTSNTDMVILYSGIIATISLYGYFSTFTYSKPGLVLYLIYQYTQIIAKLTYAGFFIAASISVQLKNQLIREKIRVIPPTPSNITIIVLGIVGQIYITYFIQNFYNILPRTRRVRSDE